MHTVESLRYHVIIAFFMMQMLDNFRNMCNLSPPNIKCSVYIWAWRVGILRHPRSSLQALVTTHPSIFASLCSGIRSGACLDSYWASISRVPAKSHNTPHSFQRRYCSIPSWVDRIACSTSALRSISMTERCRCKKQIARRG